MHTITDDTRFSITSEGNAALDAAASLCELWDSGQPTVLLGDDRLEKPKPEWVRGECPQCGNELISNFFYVEGRGFVIALECWNFRGENPTCTYRKVL